MLSPGQVVERYTVEAEIGQGGLATVYRVRHNTLGNAHALKVLHVSGRAMLERLVLEGRVQASLRHPNIVAVTDVIEVGGAPGLVMEFVEGPSLDTWLHHHRPTLAEAEWIFVGILAGVAHAHRQGLIHRDLKPGNVLLQQVDGTLVPKVSDFGLVKILAGDEGGSASHTRSNVGMGTPAYMSPEQMQDAKRVDRRTDVFALGCILYELVCGRRAFEAPNLLAIFNAAASGEYTPPEAIVPGLPARIVNAITGALDPDREARIPDCAALRTVLMGGEGANAAMGGGGEAGIEVQGRSPVVTLARASTWLPVVDASTDAARLAGQSATLPLAPPGSAAPATQAGGLSSGSPPSRAPVPPAPGAPTAPRAPALPADSAASLATMTMPPPAPRRTSPTTLPPPSAPAAGWALVGAAGAFAVVGGGAVVLAGVAWLAWAALSPPAAPPFAGYPVDDGYPVDPVDGAYAPPDVPADALAGGAPTGEAVPAPIAEPVIAASATPARPSSAGGRPSAPAATPAIEPVVEVDAGPVPADLVTGSDDARETALARHESNPDMTAAIVWVLQNDPSPKVRFKAWRVVRARWRRGTGDDAAHERAAHWVVEHGSERARNEALAALRDHGRSVPAGE